MTDRLCITGPFTITDNLRILAERQNIEIFSAPKADPKAKGVLVVVPQMEGHLVPWVRGFKAENPDTSVFLMSQSGSAADEVYALAAGFDDYISPDKGEAAIIYRIAAHFRRDRTPAASVRGEMIRRGDISLFPDSHKAFLRNHEVPLSVSEFLVLKTLMRSPDRLYTQAEIMSLLNQESPLVRTDTPENAPYHIKRIRNKFNEAAEENGLSMRDFILTTRDVGYRGNPDVQCWQAQDATP
jgi:DNA-binding response OmpR family regulator